MLHCVLVELNPGTWREVSALFGVPPGVEEENIGLGGGWQVHGERGFYAIVNSLRTFPLYCAMSLGRS
jgi:hypothetical protein